MKKALTYILKYLSAFFRAEKKRLIFEASLLLALIFSALFFHFAAASIKEPEQPKPITIASSGNFNAPLDTKLLECGAYAQPWRFALEKAVSAQFNTRKLKNTDRYEILIAPNGRAIAFLLECGAKRILFSASGDKYKHEAVKTNYTRRIYIKQGKISHSLWASMSAAGLSAGVIMNFADILRWSVDFITDVRDSDLWAAEIEEVSDSKGKVMHCIINALFYSGKRAGRHMAALHKGRYYDNNGRGLENMFLRAPLQYSRISSSFSLKRLHPIRKIVMPHLGTDYAAPEGTPVSFVAGGKVKYYGRKGANGNMLICSHPLGYETYYLHLSRFAKNMYIGKRVKQGDIAGYVGHTGAATGPHLDFRIKQNGRFFNFEKMKRVSRLRLKSSERALVQKALSEFKSKINISTI